MEEVIFRIINLFGLSGFLPYLLPETIQAIKSRDPAHVAVGAVLGRTSIGGGAFRVTEDTAYITCLFVDPHVRGYGIGTGLFQALLSQLPPGVKQLRAEYVLKPPELLHMDALMVKMGFPAPTVRSYVFTTWSHAYRNHPLLGRAMDPAYRTPENILPFSALSEKHLTELAEADDVPDYLSWETHQSKADVDLSCALLENGAVVAYLLCGEGGEDGILLLSALRREGAPPAAILLLLLEMGNRAYYRKGRSFPLYFSAQSEQVTQLGQKLMGDSFDVREEHLCQRPVSPEQKITE